MRAFVDDLKALFIFILVRVALGVKIKQILQEICGNNIFSLGKLRIYLDLLYDILLLSFFSNSNTFLCQVNKQN